MHTYTYVHVNVVVCTWKPPKIHAAAGAHEAEMLVPRSVSKHHPPCSPCSKSSREGDR